MANVIGKTRGYRKSGAPRQQADQTALGDSSVRSEANTWQTFTEVTMNADGSGVFIVKRNGLKFVMEWNAETNDLMIFDEDQRRVV